MAKQEPGEQSEPQPQTVETIPGMGPIRARALKKAGWDSIASLKKATVAELSAVRGITEIKAQQLYDYLHSVKPAPKAPEKPVAKPAQKVAVKAAATPAAAKTERAPRAVRTPAPTEPQRRQPATPAPRAARKAKPAPAPPPTAVAPPPTVPPPTVATPVPTAPPEQEQPHIILMEIAANALAMLNSEKASVLERSLARQLGKLAALADHWDAKTTLGPKKFERAVAQLRRIREALSEAAAFETLGKKAQERIGDDLRDHRKKLQGVLE